MNLKLTIAFCLACLSLQAANVADNIQTALGQGFSGTNRVRFTPVQPWLLSSNASPVIGFPVGVNTDTNGNFGATNIIGPAFYNVDVVNSGILPFRVLIPGGSATYNLWQVAQLAQQASLFNFITNISIGTNGVNVAPGALVTATTNNAGPVVTISAMSQTNTVVQTNDTRAVTLYNQVGGTITSVTMTNATNSGTIWGPSYSGGAGPLFFLMRTNGGTGIRLDDNVGDVLDLSSNGVILTDIMNDALNLTGNSGGNGSAQLEDGGGDAVTLQSGKFSLSTGAQFAGNGSGLTNVPLSTNSINATNLIGALVQANVPAGGLIYTGSFTGSATGLTNISGPISNAWNTITPELPPFNAKGDGVTDDTVALQKAFDTNNLQIAAGLPSKIRLTPGANYKITANLLLKKFNVEGNANDWPLFATITATGTAGLIQTNPLVGNMSLSHVALQGSGTAGQVLLRVANSTVPVQALHLDHVSFLGAVTGLQMTNMDELCIHTVLAYQCTNGIQSYSAAGQPIQSCVIQDYHANCVGEAFYGENGNYHFIDLDSSGNGNSHQIHYKGSFVLFDNPNIEGASITDTNHFNIFADASTTVLNLGSINQIGNSQPSICTTNTSPVFIHSTILNSDGGGNHIKSYDGNNTRVMSDLTLQILDMVSAITYKTVVNSPGLIYGGISGNGNPQHMQAYDRLFFQGDGTSSGAGRFLMGVSGQNGQFANYIRTFTEATGPNNITTEFGGVWGDSSSMFPWFYLRNNNTGQGFVGVGNSNPQANFDNAGSTLLENGVSITNAPQTNWSIGGTPLACSVIFTNLAAGVAPNAVYPNGSLLITTNGAWFIRTNNTWLQK